MQQRRERQYNNMRRWCHCTSVSEAGQHPEKDEAGSLMRYFSPATSGQVMPELMGAIMILSAYQE